MASSCRPNIPFCFSSVVVGCGIGPVSGGSPGHWPRCTLPGSCLRPDNRRKTMLSRRVRYRFLPQRGQRLAISRRLSRFLLAVEKGRRRQSLGSIRDAAGFPWTFFAALPASSGLLPTVSALYPFRIELNSSRFALISSTRLRASSACCLDAVTFRWASTTISRNLLKLR